jgi:hypothetical protein
MAEKPAGRKPGPAAVPSKYAAYLAEGQLTAAQKAEAEGLKLAPLSRQPVAPAVAPMLAVLAVPARSLPRPGSDNWPAWGLALRSAVKTHANGWLSMAEIVTGSIQGANAFSRAGAFRSAYPLAALIEQELVSGGVPSPIARPWSEVFARAWSDWSDSLMLPGLPFYPMFQAWPAPMTAVMSNLPVPLSACPAPGAVSLTPAVLSQSLLAAVPTGYRAETAAQPVREFSSWFSSSFTAWQSGVVVQNVLGWGTTAFGPPYVPVAPVIDGTLRAPPGFITQRLI